MNHKEEQAMEIEALESIYCRELEVLEAEPYYKFAIPVQSYVGEAKEEGLKCTLVFKYTEKYPEEPPIIEIQEEDFDEIDVLIKHLQEQAQENLGMVMIFQLVSAAHEWLELRCDEKQLEQEASEAQRKKDEEEAELKRFTGTPVTVETFTAWKQTFQSELDKAKKMEKDEKEARKLTGKELFMQDKTLNESDLKFLEEGDEVKVDEALFDLDGLEFDEEEEDEENS